MIRPTKENITKQERQMVKYMYAVLSDNLLTGNDKIDGQHKELISKINKLVKSCENGSCQIESIKILDYLADYTEFHFGMVLQIIFRTFPAVKLPIVS